jgi:hypothetical protein
MAIRRGLVRAVLATALLVAAAGSGVARGPLDVPGRLSDQEFWRLTEVLSEPNGTFRSDNLVSNELVFARVLPELAKVPKTASAYLGVGPEQNFTYMAALRPKLAVILDIRRGNLHLQLMYKALFELAADRAEFLSLLFTKPRPAGLGREASARELMEAYWTTDTSADPVYQKNLQTIKDVLTKKHGFALSPEDLKGIEYVYYSFYWFGPSITWSSSSSGAPGARAHYKDLVLQTDISGQELSYLASEDKFAFLKDLEARNLVVPVVGNFGGPKAIKAIGAYLKGLGATVTAFYVSNVEQYLRQDGLLDTFLCSNVRDLPLDRTSVFIRPSSIGARIGVVSSTVTLNGQVIRVTPPTTTTSVPIGGSPISAMLVELTEGCKAGGGLRPAPVPR